MILTVRDAALANLLTPVWAFGFVECEVTDVMTLVHLIGMMWSIVRMTGTAVRLLYATTPMPGVLRRKLRPIGGYMNGLTVVGARLIVRTLVLLQWLVPVPRVHVSAVLNIRLGSLG